MISLWKVKPLFFSLGAVTLLFLSGCAAIPLVSTSLIVNKAFIETSTGGSVKIVFEEEQFDGTIDIKNLALLPGYRIEANLAESIAAKNWVNIVTPLQIEKINPRASIVLFSRNITQNEKLSEYQRIGQEAKVDAILEYKEGDMDYENNIIAFKRSETRTKFRVCLISVSDKKEIWKKEGQVVIQSGKKIPTQGEIDELLVSSIVEELGYVLNRTLVLN